ncbi:MAG: AlpA family transcriptional regulator [Gammaproteobacteria bacterium HGW-Gammaproteobacteria-11]|nr:MAG: AlpA family transcriptional regulator [Gammaproteobacteria bacterium HGW-Gammaproteobacteria-11]
MRIMRLKEVVDTTGLARSTIYKYIGDGIFPKPVSLAPSGVDLPSTRGVGWLDSEIFDWILARIEERDLAEAATRLNNHLSVAK